MKTSISTPAAVGIAAVCLLVVIAIGFRYLNGLNRDKNGQDLTRPAVQPANMGEMFRSRVNATRGGQNGGGPAAPGAVPGR